MALELHLWWENRLKRLVKEEVKGNKEACCSWYFCFEIRNPTTKTLKHNMRYAQDFFVPLLPWHVNKGEIAGT